jgi:DNA-directed RNA polymerase specialized sigma24 family protein
MNETNPAFKTQRRIRGPWRLIRTATNLWIDRIRRLVRERELLALAAHGEDAVGRDASLQPEVSDAVTGLLQRLYPQES